MVDRAKVIGIDMDDVLTDLLTPWVAELNALSETKLSAADISLWEIEQLYPHISRQDVFDVLNKDSFWASVQPAEMADGFITALLAHGYDIRIVTSSHYKNIEAKMSRFFELFPMLSWKQVVVTSHKQDIKLDILVDDAPHNLIGGDYRKVLMAKPHNARYDAEANGMYRARDLMDAFHHIRFGRQNRT